ncbi:MAG: glycosyltransferase [Bacteroidota bacterium]|nr:glycosyltransferase [Bacteroidota bacterium]
MLSFNLSYIIATRNRLSFLKITLQRLIDELQPGEEIVVVDGDSTDGAKEYLQQLFEQGQIQQYVSEPDRNQAHGWNKALLMAKGTIIKKIIDDDVHSYSAIRKCSSYMLDNPQVDICISNGLTADLLSPQKVQRASRLKYFEAWKGGATQSFTFSDVYMLIRKRSLSYLGLFDTQFAMMDWEYSLRCSYLKANIAYYTGYNSLSIHTPGNVTSVTDLARLKKEGQIGKEKYGYEGDRSDISLYSELKIAVGKTIGYKKEKSPVSSASPQMPAFNELEAIYADFYHRIEMYNQDDGFTFI